MEAREKCDVTAETPRPPSHFVRKLGDLASRR